MNPTRLANWTHGFRRIWLSVTLTRPWWSGWTKSRIRPRRRSCGL